MIRKAGTVAIVSALLLSYVPQVWADEVPVPAKYASLPPPPSKGASAQTEAKISKEQAIELAKQYIEIPEGYTLQSVSLNSYPFKGKSIASWSLNYSKKVKEQFTGNLHMTINATTGRLTDYSYFDNDPDYKPSYPPKVDYQGAKEAAAKWLAKLSPNEQDQLRYNAQQEQSFRPPLYGSYQYNIRYDRVVNEVPFPQNGVNVTVNGDGIVTGYNYSWDDSITFEEKAAPIRAIAKVFRDQAKVSLLYQIPYEAKGEKKKPIISFNMNSFLIDAGTGELWNPGYLPRPETDDQKPLTEKPLGEKPPGNLNLTKEQAVDRLTSVIKLPEGVTLEDASYNEYTNPDTGENSSTWNFHWSQPSKKSDIGKPGNTVWATVNSKTGEIINYNHYLQTPEGQQNQVDAKISVEDAKALAIEFVKKQLPAYTDQLVMNTTDIDNIPADKRKGIRTWNITFKRVIDGVRASYENVTIGIDRTTGELTNYYFNISNLPYPEQKPKVLPIEQAKDLLFSQYDIQRMYVLADGYMPYISNGPGYEKIRTMIAAGEIPPGSDGSVGSEAKLVYALVPKYTREAFFLDAATGQWRNASTGEVISLEKGIVTDIGGHWAQNELQLMLDYEALDVVDGKVNPDLAITRGELIKMLVIAMNGGQYGIRYSADRAASFSDVKKESPYFDYVENAVDRGLIDRGEAFNPGAKMNREEVAHLIVRALGYDKLAKYEAIFNDKFTDSAKLKNLGKIAIVTGLGIMTLTEGSFHPEQEVTRAQAATAFFRYLQKRIELQDTLRYYY